MSRFGPPDELYDHPNSEFVMSFLGPVTTLDNHLVRPHDVEIETHPFDKAYPGRIERFNRVGFEVRLDVQLAQHDKAPRVLVTLTRAEATAKALEPGIPVWIKPVANASQVRITTPTDDESRPSRRPTPRLGAATYVYVDFRRSTQGATCADRQKPVQSFGERKG